MQSRYIAHMAKKLQLEIGNGGGAPKNNCSSVLEIGHGAVVPSLSVPGTCEEVDISKTLYQPPPGTPGAAAKAPWMNKRDEEFETLRV